MGVADFTGQPAVFIPNKWPISPKYPHISVYEPFYRHMQERMKSKAGQEAYRNRYKIEHKVADLARYCGMRRCRYRGLERAKIHTLLSAITSNIKRMARLLCLPAEKPPSEAALAC